MLASTRQPKTLRPVGLSPSLRSPDLCKSEIGSAVPCCRCSRFWGAHLQQSKALTISSLLVPCCLCRGGKLETARPHLGTYLSPTHGHRLKVLMAATSRLAHGIPARTGTLRGKSAVGLPVRTAHVSSTKFLHGSRLSPTS